MSVFTVWIEVKVLWVHTNVKILQTLSFKWDFPGGSEGKASACNVGDPGSLPGLGRSPGEGKSYPFQYSDLENSMHCVVHGVAKSQT